MSDVTLSLDTIVIEGINISYLSKSNSKLNTNYNNGVKKDLKTTTKELDYLDKWIVGLSAISNSKSEFIYDKRSAWKSIKEFADLVGFAETSNQDLLWTLERAIYRYPTDKKTLTIDELILACNSYTEYLEKKLIDLQTKLEKAFTDDQWLLHLTFSKNCYINIKGSAGKKVYNVLLDKKNHTFVFKLDPEDVKDADEMYHLALTAIDAEEV